jgi:hypothetical protein
LSKPKEALRGLKLGQLLVLDRRSARCADDLRYTKARTMNDFVQAQDRSL